MELVEVKWMASTHHKVFCLISVTIIRGTRTRALLSESIYSNATQNIFVQQKHPLKKIKYVMHIIKCRNRIPTRLLLWAPCSFASPDPHVLQGRDVNTWHCFPSTLQEMHHSSLWGNCHVFLTGKCKNNY